LRYLYKQDEDDDEDRLSLERLLVESSKLQDHKQSCVIHNVTVESTGLSYHCMKTNVAGASKQSKLGTPSYIIIALTLPHSGKPKNTFRHVSFVIANKVLEHWTGHCIH